MKKLGGLDYSRKGKLEEESLAGLSDRECAEAVAVFIVSSALIGHSKNYLRPSSKKTSISD